MAADLPKTMKACKVVGQSEVELVIDAPVPVIEDDEILVKCIAAAQNPIDWQCVFWPGFIFPGHTVGCDYAGIVVRSNSPRYTPGDRVAGFTHGDFGPSKDNGAFGEYVRGNAAASFKIPDSMTFEDAATMPVSIATVGQVFWGKGNLGLKHWDDGESEGEDAFLVYGGSTSTGAMAIQMAKAAGVLNKGGKLVSCCGPRNIEFLKNLGTDVVFDRSQPDKDLIADIRRATGNKLTKAFDPIARDNSPHITTSSIGPTGGVVHCTHILDATQYRDDVQLPFRIVFNVLGKPYSLAGMEFPAEDDAPGFIGGVFEQAEKWIAEGKIKPHPVRVVDGGLAAVAKGMELSKSWMLTGEKIVYRVEDTTAETKA